MSNTNQRFVQDINRLITVRNERKPELPKVSFEPIAAARGVGDATALPTSQSEGIASPLKEIPGRREYYDPQLVKSSDGLFVIEQQTLKKAVFIDENGTELAIEFSDV